MPSTTKQNYDHDSAGRAGHIIEVRSTASTDTGQPGLTEASIMCPAPQFQTMGNQGGGASEARQAAGVTWGHERQRSGPHGATVAADAGTRPADNDAQRDRNDNNDVETVNVVETVFSAADVSAQTNELIVAAQKAIALSRVPLHASDHQYARKAELLQVSFDCAYGTERERWMLALAAYAPSANSFFLMRAALRWQKKRELAGILEMIASQQPCPLGLATDRDLIAQLESGLSTLRLVQGLQRQDILDATGGQSRKKMSLKDELGLLPAGWQEKIVAHAQSSEAYADAIAILALVGCRPDELERGVSVRLDREPAVIRIRGAKLGEHSGQPWREIDVATSALPPHLLRCLQDERDVAFVTIPSTDALRQALYRISEDLWPGGLRVAPYHFRHSRAETLRENGWAAHEIAAVLGEQSAHTVSHYGRKTRPGKRKPPHVPLVRDGVRVSIPVPPLPAFDPGGLSRRSRPTTGGR